MCNIMLNTCDVTILGNCFVFIVSISIIIYKNIIYRHDHSCTTQELRTLYKTITIDPIIIDTVGL